MNGPTSLHSQGGWGNVGEKYETVRDIRGKGPQMGITIEGADGKLIRIIRGQSTGMIGNKFQTLPSSPGLLGLRNISLGAH